MENNEKFSKYTTQIKLPENLHIAIKDVPVLDSNGSTIGLVHNAIKKENGIIDLEIILFTHFDSIKEIEDKVKSATLSASFASFHVIDNGS